MNEGEKSLVLRLDSETFDQIRVAARADSSTLGEVVRLALTLYLARFDELLGQDALTSQDPSATIPT